MNKERILKELEIAICKRYDVQIGSLYTPLYFVSNESGPKRTNFLKIWLGFETIEFPINSNNYLVVKFLELDQLEISRNMVWTEAGEYLWFKTSSEVLPKETLEECFSFIDNTISWIK